jgi:hypothetical protein
MLQEVVDPNELGTTVRDPVWVTDHRDFRGRWNRRDDEPASLPELLRRDAEDLVDVNFGVPLRYRNVDTGQWIAASHVVVRYFELLEAHARRR